MFAALRKLLTGRFGSPAETQAPEAENAEILRSTVEIHPEITETTPSHPVPYDENLLERARTQWQFGDWESLSKLEWETLQHHPDRAKLALLGAAGRLQMGQSAEVRQFVRLAQDWGGSKKLISQILIAGVHNSLGRAAAMGNQPQRALEHFESGVDIGVAGGGDAKLLTQARMNEQAAQLQSPEGFGVDTARPGKNYLNPELYAMAHKCMKSKDVHESIDNVVSNQNISTKDLVLFYIEISDQFTQRNDKVTALHFLLTAKDQLLNHDKRIEEILVNKIIAIGHPDLAADIAFNAALNFSKLDLSDSDKKAIQTSYESNRQAVQVKSEHGHDLLLAYLQSRRDQIKPTTDVKPTLIEIGTTRENLPGQGSTRKIAQFCKNCGLHFITVDMDPHNTRMAAKMFLEMGVEFEAITMKGEDYLKDVPKTLDYVFLDAYDFDHGGHSELRQSRYQKFLGSPIDEIACHQMHLDCAKQVVGKLALHGVVCFDDTWLVDGKWVAKGTTAMPYLLKNGFKVVDARNHAALLVRVSADQSGTN